MVRKVIAVLMCVVFAFSLMATQTLAYTHTVYDSGAPSNSYLTYYKDILSGIPFNYNYVAFRDSQNSYIMVVGKLECTNEVITLIDNGTAYIFKQEGSNYNNQYRYYVEDIDNFSVDTNNYIVYSDVGEYPELMERGAKYEVLTTVIICITCLCVVISRIFRRR